MLQDSNLLLLSVFSWEFMAWNELKKPKSLNLENGSKVEFHFVWVDIRFSESTRQGIFLTI